MPNEGTGPLHVGEAYIVTYMRLLGKDLLMTAKDNAKEVCGGFQLCEGLEVGILRVLLILFARCGRMRVGHLIQSLMLKSICAFC